MKKIYALEALKFGFKTFFKNPIFFVLALVISKLLWIAGFCISFLIALPYFLHLIDFIKRIYMQIRSLIAEFSIGGIIGGLIKPAFKDIGFGVFSKVNAFGGFIQDMGKAVTGVAKAPLKAVTAPVGKMVRGVTGITALEQKVTETLQEVKEILREILANKFLFVFFLIGVIIFLICLKFVYDYIMLGWARMSLEFCDRKSGSIKSLFSRPDVWAKYVLATVIFLFISVVPTLVYFWFYLLITYFVKIPRFLAYLGYMIAFIVSWYFVLRLWFYPYYLVDENIGAIKSLQKSYNLGLGFLNVIISLCVFGLILGIPLLFVLIFPNTFTVTLFGVILAVIWMAAWVSYAYIYRKLK